MEIKNGRGVVLDTDVHRQFEHDQWLEARKKHVGASEVAAILGLSPFRTPLNVWARKTGKAAPIEQTQTMRFGHLIEPVIVELFVDETLRTVQDPGEYEIAKTNAFPRLGATLDRIQHPSDDRALTSPLGLQDKGVLELKNVGWRVADRWEDDDGNQIVPVDVDAQVQACMAASDLMWGSVAALIGGPDFRWIDIERKSVEWFEALNEALEAFWKCVTTDTPPEPKRQDNPLLKHLYPMHVHGKVIQLPIEAVEIGQELRRWKAEMKALKDKVAGHDATVKGWMGEAEYGVAPDGGSWTWKAEDRKEFTVAAKTVRVLRAKAPKK